MRKKKRSIPSILERLEARQLLSAALVPTTLSQNSNSTQIQPTELFRPTYEALTAGGSLSPLNTSGPTGYTPAEIRNAYGLNQVSFNGVAGDGTGQTIAIIDAYNDPNIKADLHAFDVAFGLADPTFSVVSQTGGSTLPSVDPVGPGGSNFEGEEALDVEWAHALAPKANIILVEANDASPSNIFAAVNFARQLAGVSVVSMSFGGTETASETAFDAIFATPANHVGVTFVASTGDDGTPAGYPAYSPNVVATGGTSLSLDSVGNYQSEIGWSGSGGGISTVEPRPSYQNGLSASFRMAPDVAFDADPRTGVAVYDSYNNGAVNPWYVLGGTSVAAPAWSGIFAVADQGRVAAGKTSLDSRTGTLPLLYSAPAADFHDITSGNNGLPAKVGYDFVTGRGSPLANLLIPYLVNGTVTVPPPLTGPTIASITASASTVTEGQSLVLTANAVSDVGGTNLAVTFYEETNGVAGLQTGTGGDFAFSPVTNGSNAISLDTSNSTGTFTFYAQLTDASGAASPSGTNAPSVTVTVVAPNAFGPTVGSITATPNPVVTGNTVTLVAKNLTDPQASIRRVTYYEETNGTPGLQTGVGGDFAFRATTSANGFTLALDTTGVTGAFTFYAQASDSFGNVSATGLTAPSISVTVSSEGVPASPLNLQAFAVSPNEIDLTFNEPASDQTGFSIQRAQDANFATFTRVFSIDRPDALSYSDTGLTSGARYYYRVQATNDAGVSSFSNIATAATPLNTSAPIGSVDVAGPSILAGWAIDRDSPASAVTMELFVDGALSATQPAAIDRLDLISVFGSADHGYSFDLTGLSPGVHRLDVFALDTSTNAPWQIGAPMTVNTNRTPLGSIDVFDGVTLAGWAFDPDAGANAIQIRYVIDNNAPVVATASVDRPDLLTPIGTVNHGYFITLPALTAGMHTVTVFAVDSTSLALTSLGTREVTVAGPAGNVLPLGNVDMATSTEVAGWAMDGSSPGASINIRVDVDGVAGTVFAANLPRADVSAKLHVAGNFGFDRMLTLSAGEHRLDIYAMDTPSGTAVLLSSSMVQAPSPVAPRADPAGNIDLLTQTQIAGWAWSSALAGAAATIRIDVDSLPGTATTTTMARTDLTPIYGIGNFGFSLAMPGLAPGVHTIALWLIDPLTLTATQLMTRTLATQ